jgi:hypothetical protein
MNTLEVVLRVFSEDHRDCSGGFRFPQQKELESPTSLLKKTDDIGLGVLEIYISSM